MHAITRQRLIAAALLLLALTYALQTATPLRLNTDAVLLLRISESLRHGEGFTVDHRSTQFPVGYPTCLALMQNAGIARSPAFVAFNLLCLSVALWSFWRIARREWGMSDEGLLLTTLLTLCSFSMVKHVTIPLTEMPFMALSLLSLDLLSNWQQNEGRGVWRLMLGLILAIAAISVRTIGIALAPAIVWGVIAIVRRKLSLVQCTLVIIAGIAAAVVLATIVSHSAYLVALRGGVSNPLQFLRATWAMRIGDAAQMAMNLPIWVTGESRWVYAIGALAIVLVGCGLNPPKQWDVTDVYLLAYGGIMAVWPYADPRFWNPVLPFLIVLVGRAINRLCRGNLRRAVPAVFGSWYVATGIAAVVFSTRLSCSGASFADRYGSDEIRSSYQAAFHRPITGSARPNAAIIHLLQEYEPLARPVSNGVGPATSAHSVP